MIALLVEDEPLIAMLAGSILRDFGYTVFEAAVAFLSRCRRSPESNRNFRPLAGARADIELGLGILG